MDIEIKSYFAGSSAGLITFKGYNKFNNNSSNNIVRSGYDFEGYLIVKNISVTLHGEESRFLSI